jgi:hypothetical protein
MQSLIWSLRKKEWALVQKCSTSLERAKRHKAIFPICFDFSHRLSVPSEVFTPRLSHVLFV